jgi:hypothetical protein
VDEQTREFVSTFQTFMRDVVNQSSPDAARLTPIGERVEAFLGEPIAGISVVTHAVQPHRLVDADVALTELSGDGSELLGLNGGQSRDHASFTDLLSHPFMRFSVGPVDYVSVADGPDSSRRVVSFGLRLLRWRGEPLAVLQRSAAPERGRASAALEVLTPNDDVSTAFLDEVKRLMVSHSVLRGQVLSFTGNQYGNSAAGAAFLPRPTVTADDVILAPGVLERVARHVVGLGEQRDALREAGQHLKRGVLLYGPPGTGKTLTVRHLLARTPGTTAVLLTGSSIQFVTEAAELARAMQPAIIVIEDVDLVASDRSMHGGPQPLLFAVLDALDGLDGDADVAFILTTNRVEDLERALAQRPGRIDLAVEIRRPGVDERRRLFRHYSEGLPLSRDALDAAAHRSEGTTGSFAKEAIRRSVLAAALRHEEVSDRDLEAAIDDLMEAGEELTRALLGGGDAGSGA